MNILVRKNLTLHKERNNLTAIIYSVGLGIVIFLLMEVRLQFAILRNIHSYSDCTFALKTDSYRGRSIDSLEPSLIQPVLNAHENEIEEWAYQTQRLDNAMRIAKVDIEGTYIQSVAGFNMLLKPATGYSPSPMVDRGKLIY